MLFPIPALNQLPKCLQLRRAIGIQAEGKNLLEKHAIAPSAARLCYSRLSIQEFTGRRYFILQFLSSFTALGLRFRSADTFGLPSSGGQIHTSTLASFLQPASIETIR
jgi:hypothetical protein